MFRRSCSIACALALTVTGCGQTKKLDPNAPEDKVQCNKDPIAKRFDPSPEGATAHAAFVVFVAAHREKNKDESWPTVAEFKKKGPEDSPTFFAQKDGHAVARLDVHHNLDKGGGFYVMRYEVCPAKD